MAAVLALLVALSACTAPRPTQQEMAAADYGPYPADYQGIVQDYYDRFLSKTATAEYTWLRPPYRGHIYYTCGKLFYGYLVRTEIAISDAVTGRVRRVRRIFLINDGAVVDRMFLNGKKKGNSPFCSVDLSKPL
jgi:hypothetical protein